MKQKIINALTKNLGLKLLALVLSFFLWVIVVNIENPEQPVEITAHVKPKNVEALKQEGKRVVFRDGIDTVKFKVTAKRSIAQNLTPSDFKVIADYENLDEAEQRIPVEIVPNERDVTIIGKKHYIYVNLEDEATQKFVVSGGTTGKMGPGLEVKKVSCAPTYVTLTGPEEVLSQIKTVKATIDVSDVTANPFSDVVIPKYYDKRGKLIDIDAAEVATTNKTVTVSVEFSDKKAADITVKTSGTLPSGFSSYDIKTDPSAVVVIGESGALNEVSNITIPDSVINLSNLNGSHATTVDISSYLPRGVTLAESSPSKVTIYVLVDGEDSKVVEVPASNIAFTNVADGHVVSLDGDPVSVTVFGLADTLKKLDVSQIKGTIDCSTLTVGNKQNVAIQFDKLDGITVQNTPVAVSVTEGKTTSN